MSGASVIFLSRIALGFTVALLGTDALSAQARPALSMESCKVPGGTEIVRCAHLLVPENWSNPNGRKIALNIVVMPKVGPGAEQPPVIWLEGGPGVPGTQSASLYSSELKFHRMRRAVVLFDMRGTGASNPLHCPKTENRSPLADMWNLADETACRHELEKRADLTRYTTAAAARDVDAIRQALGFEKIDLMALSYGTYLAQAYMKLYPAHVRAVALMGSVPLGEKLPLHHSANAEAVLHKVFADCRADAGCHRAFPHLEGDWAKVTERFAKAPVVVKTPSGTVTIRSGPFLETVRGQLNTTFAQRALPLLITRAARGDFGPLLKLVQRHEPELEADGLYLAISCPEGTNRIKAADIARATAGLSFGRWRIDQQIAACRMWPPTTLDAALLTPVKSNVPVVFFAGGRDATTPVKWADQIAANLPRSRVVVIEQIAHLPIGLSNIVCVDRIAATFFAKGSADGLDTSCIATMKPPPFRLHE
jgi:pimeloyl-ACP methyl ester carboxylesterase